MRPIKNLTQIECPTTQIISQISPTRLIDGGAAMLVADTRKKDRQRAGNLEITPLHRTILREKLLS